MEVGYVYTYALGFVYYLTTDSLFLGSVLSVLAWLASAFILVRIMRLLSIDKSGQINAMLVYALLPSSILFTSVTLREPYQLLFANLAVYSALKIYLHRSIGHWLVLFCAVIGGGVMHGALFSFGLFVVIATLISLALRRRKGISAVKLAFMAPLIAMLVIYGLLLLSNVGLYQLDEGLGRAVEIYQLGALGTDARANYRDAIEISGTTGLLLFIPVSLFQYLFEPLPGHISTAADIGAAIENLLRAWLIWRAGTGLLNVPAQARSPVLFVFLSYLIFEIIWALGTINWGTAARHHIPSFGLLVVAAYAYARNSLKRRRNIKRSGGNAAGTNPVGLN